MQCSKPQQTRLTPSCRICSSIRRQRLLVLVRHVGVADRCQRLARIRPAAVWHRSEEQQFNLKTASEKSKPCIQRGIHTPQRQSFGVTVVAWLRRGLAAALSVLLVSTAREQPAWALTRPSYTDLSRLHYGRHRQPGSALPTSHEAETIADLDKVGGSNLTCAALNMPEHSNGGDLRDASSATHASMLASYNQLRPIKSDDRRPARWNCRICSRRRRTGAC